MTIDVRRIATNASSLITLAACRYRLRAAAGIAA
jgi:hypothetical protein